MGFRIHHPVLVVEPHKSMVVILRNILRQVGVPDVLDAKDGSTALGILEQYRVDFILSELHTEPMTGLQLLREVRGNRDTKGIPFMIMTGDVDETTLIASKRAGVSGFLVKPFAAADLHKRLERILGVS